MRSETVDAVLARLGVARPAPTLEGLRELYRAWCRAVPFDNVQKLLHLSEGRRGPLPGSSAESFFADWLAHGTGGTCWAGNGAWHDLLAALGFPVVRAAATMMVSPETPPSNHGSVIATFDGVRWIADASILSVELLRIPGGEGPWPDGARLPRVEVRRGTPYVVWRTFTAPDGFDCRFDRAGLDAREWDALHQRTAGWGPFNYAISARVCRGRGSIGLARGVWGELDPAGELRSGPIDRAGRDRLLIEELRLSPSLVARLPEDREMPPPPGS